jgi:hypothetical protein
MEVTEIRGQRSEVSVRRFGRAGVRACCLLPAAACLLLVSGCATAPRTGNPLTDLRTFTVDDVQAALDDATAHNDLAASNCYGTLIEVLTAPAPARTPPKGLVSTFQQARDLLNTGTGAQGLAQRVNIGCAALFVDAQFTLAKLGLVGVGAAATGGILPGLVLPVLPAMPRVP